MKKTFVFFLCAVLALTLAACSPLEGENGANVIIVSLGAEPETIDPSLNTALDGASYLSHLFQCLVSIDKDQNEVPGAAESWDISEDMTVYTYHLRRDAKWSDGKPVTANDFLYAWQRLIDPATASGYAYYAYYIKNAEAINLGEADMSALGVKVLDDYTLEVTLESPVAYWDQLMTFICFAPLRKDIIESDPVGWTNDPSTLVSNGPFKLKKWYHDQYIHVVKNEYYWDTDSISDIEIKFALLSDANTVYAAFQNGELLFAYELIPSSEIENAKAAGTLTIIPQLSTSYYSINNEKEYFKDARVRKALSLAIDRQFLTDSILKSGYIPAGAQVGPGFDEPDGRDFREVGGMYLDPSSKAYDENVAEAKRLMAEAGYPDGKGFPTIEFLTDDVQVNADIAEVVQQMWKENLGVNMKISMMEWGVFIPTRKNGEYDIARDGWSADFRDPVAMLDLYLSGGIGANNAPRYKSEKFDNLIAQSRKELDQSKRMQILHEAEDTLIGKDWAVIPLSYYTSPILTSPKLKGVVSTNIGYQYFMWCSVEE